MFEFTANSRKYVCGLREIPTMGVEAVFFMDGELLTAHTWPNRELAIAWAQDMREILERDQSE